VAALVIAIAINGLTLALIVVAAWLALYALPAARGLGVLLGLMCVALAVILLPRLPGARGYSIDRAQYPRLYELANRVAAELGVPNVDDLRFDLEYNASFGQYGWRRRPILTLGVPLAAVLDGPELVALLGHELAHNVNRDPARGLFLSTAMYSLSVWYELLDPRRRLHISAGIAQPLLVVFNIISTPITLLIWLVGYALAQLLWYDSQRAEYHADHLAAEIGGTAAYLSVLNKTQLYAQYRTRLKIAYLARKGQPEFFVALKREADQVPERELTRLRRVEWLLCQRFGTTHPPTTHRREFLSAHPAVEPRVRLSPAEQAALNKELTPLILDIQRQIFALDEYQFREMFRFTW
jgi:heat shock protein HtpX